MVGTSQGARSFLQGPAIVFARFNQIHFFPGVKTNITNIYGASDTVEGHPKWIADTIGVGGAGYAGRTNKRICGYGAVAVNAVDFAM